MNEDFEPNNTPNGTPSSDNNHAPGQKKNEKRRMSAAAVLALAICFFLLGGIAGYFGTNYVSGRLAEDRVVEEITPEPAPTEVPEPEATESAPVTVPETPSPEPTQFPSEEPTQTPGGKLGSADFSTQAPSVPEKMAEGVSGERVLMSAADVYEANVNSTVGITTSITTTNYWGYQSSGAASGSGFIYSKDGYILTNYHVVGDSSSITVTSFDGTAYKAEIVGYDKDNDIAVLKIDAEDLKPVTLGSSDRLRVGDEVLAIGNPLGELTFSLTKGWVSALNREVTLSGGTTMDLIQTDTAINSGNSGGALFNMYGEVVGITNAKYSSSGYSSSASVDNIGFAIPIDSIKRIVEEIIEYGHAVKPYIGVTVYTVTAEMQEYGLPQGAAVQEISGGSPADDAGLKKNDIITAVNGKAVTTSSELKRIISRSSPGDKLAISVFRQNEGTVEITAVVGERPQAEPSPEPESKQPGSGEYNWDNDPFGGFPFNGFPFGNFG